MAQMACALEQADIIMRHPAGERVRLYAPFVSAGTPGGHWDGRYLLRDPRAYEALGNWMRQA
jgi:hypothetical protein